MGALAQRSTPRLRRLAVWAFVIHLYFVYQFIGTLRRGTDLDELAVWALVEVVYWGGVAVLFAVAYRRWR